jgi:hypothetical protein
MGNCNSDTITIEKHYSREFINKCRCGNSATITIKKHYSPEFINKCSCGNLTDAKKYFEADPNIDIHAY